MRTDIEVELYRSRPLIRRREWHFRAVDARNGEELARSSEGYVNKGDATDTAELLWPNARIVEVDQ